LVEFGRRGGRKPWTAVKTMFFTYLFVIVSGIAYFSVIGLTHH
jgi:hypothetical protein